MEICLYVPVYESFSAELESVVATAVPQARCSVLRSFPELSARMNAFVEDGCVFVLYAPNGTDLKAFLRLESLLLQHRVILIIPDDHPDTVSCGHLLHPRLQVTHGGEALEIIPPVLQKMFQKERVAGNGGC